MAVKYRKVENFGCSKNVFLCLIIEVVINVLDRFSVVMSVLNVGVIEISAKLDLPHWLIKEH